jgi:putative pyruvate formate lyase activating enzyme
MPQILESLIPAIENGLNIPIVYNSSGYDSVDSLRILEGIFDIYMPDFKFWNDAWAERYCKARDYREKTTLAIAEMYRQVGDLTLGKEGIATRGLLVRHLVMPGGLSDIEKIMEFLANKISTNTYVNVMNQYHPCGHALMDERMGRMIFPEEFRKAVKIAREAGITRLDSM